MTTPRWKKALYISLAAAVTAGAGWAAWDYLDTPSGYPRDVMRQANDLQERLLSFDSHITLPLTFGTEGSEADQDLSLIHI